MPNDMIDLLPPILNAAEMREADRRTIESLGIPSFTLMELAGRAVADEAMLMVDENSPARIVCLCGKGNNGGDGFVAARVLQQYGMQIDVCLVSDPSDLTGDASSHFVLLTRIAEAEEGIQIKCIDNVEGVRGFAGPELYIDALLGTGLSSEVRKPLSGIVDWLNEQKTPVLAVDLPSGLHSDDGRVLGRAVRADITVTMGALKSGLLIGDGPDYSGAVVVADIGIPHHVLDEVFENGDSTRLCQEEYVHGLIPERPRDSHKYTTGPTLVFGGSADFIGALALSATAAARIGSGYVIAICPESISDLLAEKLTEIPVSSIGQSGAEWDFDGTLTQLGTRWEKARALLVGPGLGRDPETKALVMGVLDRATAPVVVDADGLFALIGEKDFVRENANAQWVFTPHAGEFARFGGADNVTESAMPVRAARAFAKEWNVVVLMKGMPSVTAAPDGRVIINNTGNPAAATAGSGDVLSGMVAGLIAQGLDSFQAAVAAVHIGGAIADHYASTRAVNSMMASDVLSMIPDYLSNRF